MKEKTGFYIDMTACIGCRTCQIACKDKNNLEVDSLFRKVRSFETGEYPNPGYYHYSSSCNHCENPKCVRLCPTGAMHIAEDSTVQHNPEICIKCLYCASGCPYGALLYVDEQNRIGKCDACKDLRDTGENPACVDACIMRCIEWGNLSELRRRHADEQLVSDLPILPTSAETKPALLIHPKKTALEKSYIRQDV